MNHLAVELSAPVSYDVCIFAWLNKSRHNITVSTTQKAYAMFTSFSQQPTSTSLVPRTSSSWYCYPSPKRV